MKVDKYDRQIRLWGHMGQKRLSEARVALVGCDGAGIESIKNLVLPGLGQVDIWDERNIQVEDLSQSFFYEYDAVGKSRAEVASRNLLEMNPDVKGKHFCASLQDFIEGDHVKDYNLVIFSGLSDELASYASKKMWFLDIPCIFIKIVGFFMHVRLQKQLHFVESSKTTSQKYYLRITDPFPELSAYAQQLSVYDLTDRIQKASNFEQAHQDLITISNIPYVVLLLQVYHRLPEDQRKRADIIAELKRLRGKVNEKYCENWDQALSRILYLYQTPDNFMLDISMLDHPSVTGATATSHTMLRFLKAVKQFYEQSGKLPQPTQLPDMHTTTSIYIELKNVYKQQHGKDVQRLMELMGVGSDQALISDYVNNLSNLEVVEMRSYADELENPDTSILNYLQNEKDMLISMRAYKGPHESYTDLLARANQLKEKFSINELDERFIKEVHRSQGKSNIHICSIAGAVTGQEAIKLITGCFAPGNNGYMFNGAQGIGYAVKL